MSAEKPVHIADRDASQRAEALDRASRRWWRLLPKLATEPRSVFAALREEDEDDVHARQEPLLLIVILAGIGAAVLTPVWGRLLDESSVDGLVLGVLTFIGGAFNGLIDYLLIGLAVWLGLRAAGSRRSYRAARQVVGIAAAPVALSVFVTLPIALAAFGGDFFRTGGSDEGTGRAVVIGIGLAFAAWSLWLLALGLRTAFRLAWLAVATATTFAAVLVGAIVVLQTL
jgi:hypothetical protein